MKARLFQLIVLPLFAFLWLQDFSQASNLHCAKFFAPHSLRTTLLKHLQKQNWYDVERILSEENFRVSDEMQNLSGEEFLRLSSHWSATYSGYVIMTPIEPLAAIAKALPFQKGQKLVDIGSGHGQPAFVIGALHPELQITGFDIVGPKIEGAKRMAQKLELNNVEFIQQDLSDPRFHLPIADYYYLYNPVHPELLRTLVLQILKMPNLSTLKIIIFGSSWTPEILKNLGFKEVLRPTDGVSIMEYSYSHQDENPLIAELERYHRSKAILKKDYREFIKPLESRLSRLSPLNRSQVENLLLEMRQNERELFEITKESIRTSSYKDRAQFLRMQNREEFLELSELLAVFLGLEELSIPPPSSWHHIFQKVDSLQSYRQGITIQSPDAVYLGLMIGLLRRDLDAHLYVEEGAQRLNALAQKFGFSNILFRKEPLKK